MEDMTVTQEFCSFWFGRRIRRWLILLRRNGLRRVDMEPLGAMMGNGMVDDDGSGYWKEEPWRMCCKATVAG